jgi:hypothetical protein
MTSFCWGLSVAAGTAVAAAVVAGDFDGDEPVHPARRVVTNRTAITIAINPTCTRFIIVLPGVTLIRSIIECFFLMQVKEKY